MRELNEAEKQLLIAVGWLRSRYGSMAGMYADSEASRENLEAFGRRWMGKRLADWTDAYRSLTDGALLAESGGAYSLTEKGNAARKALEVTNPLWLYEYDNFFGDAAASKAHALFCERVYGKNLCQHGLADIPQLHLLLEVLRLNAGDRALDAGCGSGLITEYLHDLTGASFVGVDISEEAITQARARTAAKGERLAFGVGNMNRLDFEPHTFSAVVAVDTLYYVNDLEETLRQLIAILKPGGQMGLFFTEWASGDEDRASLLPENTSLAVLLKKYGLGFSTYELTGQEAEHWRKKVEALERLKPEFEKEGNLGLYNYRYSEAIRYANWDLGKRSRHLYHVRLPGRAAADEI
ncbi:MAG: class I SAM-dependent methyltransferase [Acidobacteriota bacterium]|nr:class I SAM-dependent methyltransferase [Acidobacteriota bacterium]